MNEQGEIELSEIFVVNKEGRLTFACKKTPFAIEGLEVDQNVRLWAYYDFSD